MQGCRTPYDGEYQPGTVVRSACGGASCAGHVPGARSSNCIGSVQRDRHARREMEMPAQLMCAAPFEHIDNPSVPFDRWSVNVRSCTTGSGSRA